MDGALHSISHFFGTRIFDYGPYRTSTIFFFRLKFLSHLFVTKLVLCNHLIRLQLRFLRWKSELPNFKIHKSYFYRVV